MKKIIPLCLAIGANIGAMLHGATITYTSNAVANWTNTSVWDLAQIPEAGDSVLNGIGTTSSGVNLVSSTTTIENLTVDGGWAIYATSSEKDLNITDTFSKTGSGNMIFRNTSGQMNLSLANASLETSNTGSNAVYFGLSTSGQGIKSLNISNGLTFNGSFGDERSTVFLNVTDSASLGLVTFAGSVDPGVNQGVSLIGINGGATGLTRTTSVGGLSGDAGGKVSASTWAPSSGTYNATLNINTAGASDYSSSVDFQDGAGGVLSVLKTGSGRQVLSYGSSDYTGGTEVQAGDLDVVVTAGVGTTPLGSGDVVLSGGDLSVDIRNGSDVIANRVIARSDVSAYSLVRGNGESFAGYELESDLSGGISTGVSLIDGDTSGQRTVTGSFASSGETQILSDVFTLAGVGADTFVLQFSLSSVTEDFVIVMSDGGTWINAATIAGGPLQFVAGAYAPEHFSLGTYGVNAVTGDVWAVLNMDGSYAVSTIPEPNTFGLVAFIALFVFVRRNHRRS